MRNRKGGFLALIAVILLSYSMKGGDEVITIDLNTTDTVTMKTSELFELDYYIFNFNSPNYLPANDDGIAVANGTILTTIREEANRNVLAVFDRNGNFKHKIGGIGRARGEYPDIKRDININLDSTISVMASDGLIYKYSLDGEFISRKHYYVGEIIGELNDKYYLVTNLPKNSDYDMAIINKKDSMKIKSYYFENKKKEKDSRAKQYDEGWINNPYYYDGDTYIFNENTKTVYKVDSKRATPRYKLIYSKNTLMAQYMKDGAVAPDRIIENDRYILFLQYGKILSVSVGDNYIYDKRSGEVKILRLIDDIILPNTIAENRREMFLTGHINRGNYLDFIIKGDRRNIHNSDRIFVDMITKAKEAMGEEQWSDYAKKHPDVIKLYEMRRDNEVMYEREIKNPIRYIYRLKTSAY